MHRLFIALITLTILSTGYSRTGMVIAMPDNDIIPTDSLKMDSLELSLEGDTLVFDLPEGVIENIDSMLNSWQSRNLLKSTADNNEDWKGITTSDTTYAERLIKMPTIVRMPYNNMVRTCIDRYTTRNRSLVSYMLGMSEFYMPIIEEEIDRQGIPHELKYLPIIESALNPKAVSRANAKGLWQFIFSTAKLYGLRSNNYIDERFDPIKSTKAALRYLNDLYGIFGSWELAIAAYNCGPGNVKKAIMRSGGKTDFWEIYRWLPRETRGYLPMFIAANYIMTYHKEHGIYPLEPATPIITDTVVVNKNLHFKQITDICEADIEEIRALNPQYIKDIIPGANEPFVLRLSNSMLTRFIANEDTIYKHRQEEFVPTESLEKMLKQAKDNDDGRGTLKRHKIRRGETLGSIALKYRVTVKQIMKWNNMRNTNIREGKYLKIY
ncbi:MAG: transglycosylase SLT domain-containing protein [Bacteroidaceae bacterium]|nr:transglycosylase SLT domain-containing protein [Bacteroidaceae bacterium]